MSTDFHSTPPPMRTIIPPDVAQAARILSPKVWNQPYQEGRGPLHYAGAPGAHADRIDSLADDWRKWADAADVLARWLYEQQDAIDADCEYPEPVETAEGN